MQTILRSLHGWVERRNFTLCASFTILILCSQWALDPLLFLSIYGVLLFRSHRKRIALSNFRLKLPFSYILLTSVSIKFFHVGKKRKDIQNLLVSTKKMYSCCRKRVYTFHKDPKILRWKIKSHLDQYISFALFAAKIVPKLIKMVN